MMYLRTIIQEKKELLNVEAMVVVQHHMKKKKVLVAEVEVVEVEAIEIEMMTEVLVVEATEMTDDLEAETEMTEEEEEIEIEEVEETVIEDLTEIRTEGEIEIDLMTVVVVEMIVVVVEEMTEVVAVTDGKEKIAVVGVTDLRTVINNVNVLPVLHEDVTTAVVAKEIKATKFKRWLTLVLFCFCTILWESKNLSPSCVFVLSRFNFFFERRFLRQK